MITPERFKEIESRASAATPPPWKVEKLGAYTDHDEARISLDDDTIESSRYENADFIAFGRQDVPDLCAEIRRQNEELEKKDGMIEWLAYKLADCVSENGDISCPNEFDCGREEPLCGDYKHAECWKDAARRAIMLDKSR